jgi:hypothetical protein
MNTVKDEKTVLESAAKSAAKIADRTRRRQTLEERLKLRQAQIADRLSTIASKQKAETTAKEARLNRLIGAACRTDATLQPRIRAVLLKATQSPKDREFLLIEGWLGERDAMEQHSTNQPSGTPASAPRAGQSK